jgi:hypothetical protein
LFDEVAAHRTGCSARNTTADVSPRRTHPSGGLDVDDELGSEQTAADDSLARRCGFFRARGPRTREKRDHQGAG